jgi:hypothetical protein
MLSIVLMNAPHPMYAHVTKIVRMGRCTPAPIHHGAFNDLLVPKVSFVTRVGDLGCGVGYYYVISTDFVQVLINLHADTTQLGEKSLVKLNFNSPILAAAKLRMK